MVCGLTVENGMKISILKLLKSDDPHYSQQLGYSKQCMQAHLAANSRI